MKVLISAGSMHGGTAGIAQAIGEAMRSADCDAEVLEPARFGTSLPTTRSSSAAVSMPDTGWRPRPS
jgi:flavodoxin